VPFADRSSTEPYVRRGTARIFVGASRSSGGVSGDGNNSGNSGNDVNVVKRGRYVEKAQDSLPEFDVMHPEDARVGIEDHRVRREYSQIFASSSSNPYLRPVDLGEAPEFQSEVPPPRMWAAYGEHTHQVFASMKQQIDDDRPVILAAVDLKLRQLPRQVTDNHTPRHHPAMDNVAFDYLEAMGCGKIVNAQRLMPDASCPEINDMMSTVTRKCFEAMKGLRDKNGRPYTYKPTLLPAGLKT
jgi:hypothetical protein